MTYKLRRLRLHGIIERVPGSHRYRLTGFDLRTGGFFTRIYSRILRCGIASTLHQFPVPSAALQRLFDKLDQELNAWVDKADVAV